MVVNGHIVVPITIRELVVLSLGGPEGRRSLWSDVTLQHYLFWLGPLGSLLCFLIVCGFVREKVDIEAWFSVFVTISFIDRKMALPFASDGSEMCYDHIGRPSVRSLIS